MKPEQQRVAIAEEHGWKQIPDGRWKLDGKVELFLPDYLNDLNAMHEAERTLQSILAAGYAKMLTSIAWESEQPVFAPMTATAAQRAEAFLRTIGKWTTPETDAETMRDEMDHVDSDFDPFAPSDTVSADFARKLKRERDEAREQGNDMSWGKWCRMRRQARRGAGAGK